MRLRRKAQKWHFTHYKFAGPRLGDDLAIDRLAQDGWELFLFSPDGSTAWFRRHQ